MGIDPGSHQPMQIIPSVHMKFPKAIITGEGECSFHSHRPVPAAWRPVGCRLPRPLAAATQPLVVPACRGAAAGYAPSVARTALRKGPSSPLPRRRPVCDYRRRPRQPPPVVAPPVPPTSLPEGPLGRRGRRSTTPGDPGLEGMGWAAALAAAATQGDAGLDDAGSALVMAVD